MTLKSSESLIDIIHKISRVLKQEGYRFSFFELNFGYQIKVEGNEKNFNINIYLKSNGMKTIYSEQEEDDLFNKFNIEESKTSVPMKTKVYKIKKEEILRKLYSLKEKNIITYELKNSDSVMTYKIRCTKENYAHTLAIYTTGTIMLQGVESEFSLNLFNHLLVEDNSIIENFEKYDLELENIIQNQNEEQNKKSFEEYLNKKKPTDEQLAVINSEDDLTVVNAVAGSGKTTTLEGVASRWSDKRILYIVYNSKMKVEAEKKFNKYKNVTVKTGHGLAYTDYSQKSGEPKSSFEMSEISKKLKKNYTTAKYIANTFEKFLIKKDLNHKEFIEKNAQYLKELYFESFFRSFISAVNRRNEYKDKPIDNLPEKEYKKIVEFLKKIDLFKEFDQKYLGAEQLLLESYKELDILIKNGEISETHDYYLKRYQMDRKQYFKYDIVMLDEAQDSNEVMLDIMEYKFPNTRKIVVGDTHQQIYSWRGAINAMDYFSELKGAKLYNLSTSFRIGQDLADVCMQVLKLKNADFNIIGAKNSQKRVTSEEIYNPKEPSGNLTILFRKNLNMLKRAVYTKEKVHFFKDINPEKFLDILYFKTGKKPKIKYYIKEILEKYSSYEQLEKWIEKKWEEDPEIIMGNNIVNALIGDHVREKKIDAQMEYGWNWRNHFNEPEAYIEGEIVAEKLINGLIPRIVFREQYEGLKQKKEADEILVLGTIHGSKGDEFDRLIVSNDIVSFHEKIKKYEAISNENSIGGTKVKIENNMTKEEIREELNLLYVSLTRSSKQIHYAFDVNRLKDLLEIYNNLPKEMHYRDWQKEMKKLENLSKSLIENPLFFNQII